MNNKKSTGDELSDILAGLTMMLLLWFLLTSVISCTSRMDLAGIEQIRNDSSQHMNNAFIISTVMECNKTIKMNQQYRKTWFGRRFISKVWDKVEIIQIPQQTNKGETK